MDDIDIKSLKLFHINRNHFNSKIYYKDGVFTTIYNNPIDLYNMFIIYEKYINHFCSGLICLIEENSKLKGYQMKKGNKIVKSDCLKYLNKNKKKLVEFMENSKYFYCDWKPNNMIKINNRISLIDLDSFHIIQKKKPNRFWGLKINWYIKKVNEIALRDSII